MSLPCFEPDDPVRQSMWQAILACNPDDLALLVVAQPPREEEGWVEVIGELIEQAPPEVRQFWEEAIPKTEVELLVNAIEMTMERFERGQLRLHDLPD